MGKFLRAKFFLFLLITAVLSESNPANAQGLAHFAFIQAPALRFTSSAQTMYPEICSLRFTAQTIFGGKARTFNGLVTTLSAPAGVTFYSDSACANPITTISFANNGSTIAFYAKATSALGLVDFTLTANNHIAVSQAVNIIANPAIWTGNASDNLWTTAGNWSGLAVPSATQVAQFDNSCTAFCAPTMPNNVLVGGVRIFPTFTGSINQTNGSSIETRGYGWFQEAGTFNGSTAGDAFLFSLTGPFKITNGIFNASTGITTLNTSIYEISGTGVFNAAGTLVLAPSTSATLALTPGTGIYNNVTISGGGNPITLTGTLFIGASGTLRLSSTGNISVITGGTIDCAGNVEVANLGVRTNTPLTTLIMRGSGTKSIDASTTALGAIPQLEINSSGTVNLLGGINIWGSYKVVLGTVVPGTATLFFNGPNATFDLNPGPETYANITFQGNGSQVYDLGASTLKVSGLLTLAGTNPLGPININNGTVELTGDMTVSGAGTRGAATVRVSGAGPTTINATAANASPLLGQTPRLEFASSGNITLLGSIYADRFFTYTSGTVLPGTSTLGIRAGPSGTFIGGSATYYNVDIGANTTSTQLIDGNLTVSNNLSLGLTSFTNVISQRTPGAAFTVSVGGTLTLVNATTTYNRNGSALSFGTLSNAGTINP